MLNKLSEYQIYFDDINRTLEELFPKNNQLYKATSDSLNTGGKRIRGIMALLACEAVSEDYKKALPIAIAYEVAHAAALIQDDMLDNSFTRRGKSSLHSEYGFPTAILASDLLIFNIFSQLAQYEKSELSKESLCQLLRKIHESSTATAYGEFLDITLGKKDDVGLKDYLEMVKYKTGALLSAPPACGAIIGNGSEHEIIMLEKFGEKQGIAYQINDDVIDIVGNEDVIGKPIFNDIKNGKKNVVVVHGFQQMESSLDGDKIFLKSIMGKQDLSNDEITKAREIFVKHGSIEFARDLATKIAEEGKEQLYSLKESSAKNRLIDLSEILTKRYS